MALVDSTPPDMFTGNAPSIAVTPSSTSFQPEPTWVSPRWDTGADCAATNLQQLLPISDLGRSAAA